jgi:queuine/archaeosine tRNA-ribosyltransferase
LVDQMRKGIEDGTFLDFKAQFMARYYKKWFGGRLLIWMRLANHFELEY